jgi:ATP-dependent Clp protease protease subunit
MENEVMDTAVVEESEVLVELDLEDEEDDVPVMRSDLDKILKQLEEEDNEKNGKYANMVGINLPEPSVALYWRDYADRAIYLEDEIGAEHIGIVHRINRWNTEDAGIPIEERKPIRLYIHSPGGSLLVSFAVCDAIKNSRTPIYGINMGECASGAALIFSSCHKRFAAPNSFFLFHLGSGGTYGTYQQTRSQQADYNHKIEQMKKLVKENLGLLDREDFDTLIDGEWYLYMDVTDGSSSDASHYNLITDDYHELF